ncbi:MAG: hypothetical protein GY869_16730 [Planctomycetes bacterium]|nr:hypothetical protein [Planctomycetota bacterium]
MNWDLVKMMGLVIFGFVVTIGLLVVVVGAGWGVLAGNGGGGSIYDNPNPIVFTGNDGLLKIAMLLIAVGCGLICYVSWELTYYGIAILDEMLQYVDQQIAYRSPWLHEKAYALISMLPIL